MEEIQISGNHSNHPLHIQYTYMYIVHDYGITHNSKETNININSQVL